MGRKKLNRKDVRFKLTGVSKMRYEMIRNQFHAVEKIETEITDHVHEETPLVMREMFARFFNPGVRRKDDSPTGTIERLAEHLHGAMEKVATFPDLQASCRMDPVLSAATAATMLKRILDDTDLPQFSEDTDEADREDELNDWMDDAEEDGTGLLQGVMARAAQAAQETVERYQAMAKVIGCGEGAQDIDSGAAIELIESSIDDDLLARMLVKVGGWHRAMSSERRKMPAAGKVTPYSVEPGSDLGRLLPSERMMLANPLTRPTALAKFMRNESLQFKMRSNEPHEAGPFHVMLDCSGSMGKEAKHIDAKAFVIASLLMAHDEGREVSLSWFNNIAWSTPLDLSTPEARIGTLSRIARQISCGGTRFKKAFDLFHEEFHSRRKGMDVVLVSDGITNEPLVDLEKWVGDADLHYVAIPDCPEHFRDGEELWHPRLEEVAKQMIFVEDLKTPGKRTAQMAAEALRVK